MGRDLPSGEVTFLFTDIEGSTKLLHELGPEGYAGALAEHRGHLRAAFTKHGGVEVDTQGDAFFYAFPSAAGAVAAADEGRSALRSGRIRVRMGVHTGRPHRTDEGYVGADVNKGARIAAAGHGGQVLLSKETRDAVSVDATDLGEHRLKDFSQPIWIFQLGDERFPPLKTISNTNLPRPASSFVGRENEVKEVVSLLQRSRLVTLSGPGGSGKTRLAIEAATELIPENRNGVFWVGLATLRDAGVVSDTIGQTLGAQDGLADHIGEKEMLLLLDNFEQVVDAAPEVSALLGACPNLRVLVTSRALLRVSGEVDYGVPPLVRDEAVELFCTRSGLEGDPTIAELCRRLDDLPLAVELAAARTKALSPAQILERLSARLDLFKGGRDADPRQATLRATIEWSHDLLTAEEQRLFARLAVFGGGCTFESAVSVADADLDTLQSLVEKSLVRHTVERFWMLETIREFAVEQMESSGEADELRARLSDHMVALAEEAAPHLRKEDPAWLDRLEAEQDNIRLAFDHLEASGQGEPVMRLAGSIWRLWSLRGPLPEGLRRVQSALSRDGRPSLARADALIGAADMTGDLGDYGKIGPYAEEALGIYRALGDRWGEAYALLALGFWFTDRRQWPEGRETFEESARLFSELGDRYWALAANRRVVWILDELGDKENALALREQNLREARDIGDDLTVGQMLAWRADQAADEGRIEDAITLLIEAHRLHSNKPGHNERYWDAIVLCRFAALLTSERKATTAASLLGCWSATFEEIASHADVWLVKKNDATLASIHGLLDDATFEMAWAKGRSMSPDQAVSQALSDLAEAGRI